MTTTRISNITPSPHFVDIDGISLKGVKISTYIEQLLSTIGKNEADMIARISIAKSSFDTN